MVRRTLRTAVLLASLVLATQAFVAIGWLRPVVVVGESMAPEYAAGQALTVWRAKTPQRWDVVVLRSPEDARRLLVKRVLGLPGERVRLFDGSVWIDGRRTLPPASPNTPPVYYGAFGNPEWRLGADEWFVAGDNQAVSVDSRNWPSAAGVPSRLIVGVAE